MEPLSGKVERFRLRLILGKFQVEEVMPGTMGLMMSLDLGNSIKMVIDIPLQADVKRGDRLTFYTEVLSKEIPNAPPLPASK